MAFLPDFPLTRSGKLSQLLVARQITTFHGAVDYVAGLPYRRLDNPRDLTILLTSSGGTFTARHALLVQLAREQGVTELMLTLCVYELDRYGPRVEQILRHYGLIGLPDMCGCLKYHGSLFTITEGSFCPQREVVSEIEIAPAQIGNFKRRYHQNYLENWLQLEGLDQSWSVEQVWRIREECLRAIERYWNGRRRPTAAYY